MTRAGEQWASWCGRALEATERDAVVGDLVEADERDRQAIWQVLGLVCRRQLSLWRDWRPWLALIGVVGLIGFLLNRMASDSGLSLVMDWRTRAKYGAPYENGLTTAQNEFIWISGWLAVATWSWTSGLLAGVLARKSSWIPSLILWLYAIGLVVQSTRFLDTPALDHYLFWLFPQMLQCCMFLFPMLVGIHLGDGAVFIYVPPFV